MAEFSAENLPGPLGQVRFGFEGGKERQIPPLAAMLRHPATNQFHGWLQVSLGELVHQLVELLAHCAHALKTTIRSTRPYDPHNGEIDAAGLASFRTLGNVDGPIGDGGLVVDGGEQGGVGAD